MKNYHVCVEVEEESQLEYAGCLCDEGDQGDRDAPSYYHPPKNIRLARI